MSETINKGSDRVWSGDDASTLVEYIAAPLRQRIAELETENAQLRREIIDARRTIAQMIWQLGLRDSVLTFFHISNQTQVEMPSDATLSVQDVGDGRIIRLLSAPGGAPE